MTTYIPSQRKLNLKYYKGSQKIVLCLRAVAKQAQFFMCTATDCRLDLFVFLDSRLIEINISIFLEFFFSYFHSSQIYQSHVIH